MPLALVPGVLRRLLEVVEHRSGALGEVQQVLHHRAAHSLEVDFAWALERDELGHLGRHELLQPGDLDDFL